MTIQPHDFSRPPRLHPDHKAKLVQWFSQANSLLVEMLATMSVPVEIRLEDCSTVWPADCVRDWSERSFALQVNLAGCDARSIFAIPNPLSQVLISCLLGDQPTELPTERDLTLVESSVGEFLISTVLGSLTEAWSGDTPLKLQVGERETNLRRTKTFKAVEPIVICRSTIQTAAGATAWCWMLSNEYLTHLFGAAERTRGVAQDAPTRVQLEALVRGMTTEVAIRLGGVQLTAPQLAKLQVGDLVVLDQRVGEPLRATIGDEPRFLGWPGRVGDRQAYVIESELSRRQRMAGTARRG
ncbi:MAG: FliM/FliN family flagellar motor switch protein [Planctomycetota bacterium]